jgi:cytochrome c peroxidase
LLTARLGGRFIAAFAFAFALSAVACSTGDSGAEASTQSAQVDLDQSGGTEPLRPLRALPAEAPVVVALGRRLFHDPLLSKDGTVSCASCHDLKSGGDDGLPRSLGFGKQEGTINAPTVLNAALNVAQFWDGRAATLEEQIDGPVENPMEMADSWDSVEKKLNARPQYVEAFQKALGAKPSREGVRRAIAVFERTLITIGSPLDRWLDGDASALTPAQKEGYALFKASGCVACHQGQNVGGNMYQRFGVFGDYFEDRGNVTEADYGRFNVTKQEQDRYVFRVPSLRNVALTAPYFHDGSAKTLEDAVGVMAKYQLGRELSEEKVSKLVAFLEALTGPEQEYLVSAEAGR